MAPDRSPALPRELRGDAGSAVAEFVMVSGLLLVLVAGLLQLGLTLHVRNTVVAAAAEGARVAARADARPGDGAATTARLIDEALRPGYAERIDVAPRDLEGLPVMQVTVTAPLPVIGLVGPGGGLTLSAHSLREG